MKISEVLKLKAASRVTEFLSTSPSDQVYSAQELSELLSIPESTIKSSRDLKEAAFTYEGRTYYARYEVRYKFFDTVNQDELREDQTNTQQSR